MICGNCHKDHDTVDEVRQCYQVGNVISIDQMTEKQYNFLQKLYGERDMTPLPPTYNEARNMLGKREASDEITHLIRDVPKVPTQKVRATDLVLPDVPEGFYAFPDLTKKNDYFFMRVDRPTEGDWAGMTFGHQIVGGKPAFKIQFESLPGYLRQISEMGVVESGLLYARELKRCRYCGRHLTKYASRALGSGPDCAEQHGFGALWMEIQLDWEHKFGKDAEVPDDVQQVRPKVAPALSTAGRSPRTSRGARPAEAVRGSSKRAS